jgi:hypothetical protein
MGREERYCVGGLCIETVCKLILKCDENIKTDLRAVEYKSILQCCDVLIRVYYGFLNMNISLACVLKTRKCGMVCVQFHVKHMFAK